MSGAVLPMQSFPGNVCGLRIRDVLLVDPALRGPELAPREEQDVQEGVHQEHQGRCRRRSGSRAGGGPLRKPLRQHFPARPYSRRGAASGPGQATICAWLPRAFSLNPPQSILSKKAAWSKNSIFPESSTSQSRSKPALRIFLGNELVILRSFFFVEILIFFKTHKNPLWEICL